MNVKRNGDVSFWYADIGGLPQRRPPLPGDIAADVCIVGAGYTGLWAAYYLKIAEPELEIAVIEKEFAGFGASGRNGGWLSGGFGWSREKYLSGGSRTGVIELERELHGTVDEVVRVAEREGIDADIHRTDCLTYACSPAQMQRLREGYEAAMSWGASEGRLTLLDAEAARSRINVPNASGALVTHGVARVQPAKLVRGLAATVERHGVRIYESTRVLEIEKGCVVTDRGVVTAPRILRATEGFTPGLKGAEREWLPLNSALVVTEPVPDSLWREIGWSNCELLADASHTYCYAQRSREGRIAMGGRGVPYRFGSRVDDSGRTQPETIEKLKEILYRMLPQTRGLALDHAWCGVLGVPRDWCATVGMDGETGIGWAGGYVGLGVSTSNLTGRTLADLALDRETPLTRLPWVNRKVRKWEPEPFRWLGVHSMYWLYRLADRREAASDSPATARSARFANWITGR